MYAATRTWDNHSGGNFTSSFNWESCGPFCNPVPDSNDIAYFSVSDPSSLLQFVYITTFAFDVSNAAVEVDDDFVTFDLNGHTYTTGTATDDISFIGGFGRGAALTVIGT